jgi:hypothetical protein
MHNKLWIYKVKEICTNYNFLLKFFYFLFLISFLLIDFSSKIISYKFIFIFQIFCLFLLIKRINFKITIEFAIFLFILIWLTLNYFLNAAVDLRSNIFIILFFALPLIVDSKFNLNKLDLKKLDFKYNIFIFFFFIIIIIFSFKISNVNTQVTDFFHQSQNLYLSKYLYNGFYEQIFVKRFGYHNLDPNFSAILLLILFQIIILIHGKNNFFLFSLFAVIILFFTGSKAGLVYYLFVLIFDYFKIFNSSNKVFFLYILSFLFILISSVTLVKNAPTPFYDNPYNVEKHNNFIKWRYDNHKYFQDILFCLEHSDQLKDHNFSQEYLDDVKFSNKYYEKLNKLTKKIKDKTEKTNLIAAPKFGQKYFCAFKLKRNNLFMILNHSNYHRFYTYGSSFIEMMKNKFFFIFINPYDLIKKSGKYSPTEMRQYFSPHSMLVDVIIRFGFPVFSLFLFQFYLLIKKLKNPNIITPFFFSSMFLSFDTFLFVPLLILLIVVKEKYES